MKTKKRLSFTKWAEGFLTRNKKIFRNTFITFTPKDLNFIPITDKKGNIIGEKYIKRDWLVKFKFVNNPGYKDQIKMIARQEKYPGAYDKEGELGLIKVERNFDVVYNRERYISTYLAKYKVYNPEKYKKIEKLIDEKVKKLMNK